MSTEVPKTMRAFVQVEPKVKAEVRDIAVPGLQPNDVLIRVAYAALNPTDYKHSHFGLAPEAAIIGCDLSGTIVALGSDVKNSELQIGTKVATVVHGGKFYDKGSFAEYARAESELVWKLPENLDLKEAASFPLALITNGQLMFQSIGEKLPPAKVSGSPWILVYGGSTGMGIFTVQLAKAAGYKVIAVQSEHNFDLVKSYGADELVDYKDADKCVEQIKQISGGGVKLAVDLISLEDSIAICLKSFAEGSDNKLRLTLPQPESTKTIRSDVDVVNTLAYTAFGYAFQFTPAVNLPSIPEHRKFFEELVKVTPQLIKEHNLRAPPIEVREGLEAVPQAFDDMMNNRISGKKVVFKIAA